jgi:hypothetical protein
VAQQPGHTPALGSQELRRCANVLRLPPAEPDQEASRARRLCDPGAACNSDVAIRMSTCLPYGIIPDLCSQSLAYSWHPSIDGPMKSILQILFATAATLEWRHTCKEANKRSDGRGWQPPTPGQLDDYMLSTYALTQNAR